jgi:aldehyde:ferredoxin oxidoreductase
MESLECFNKNNEAPRKDAYMSPQGLNLMLDYYYTLMGWTKEGVPTIEKLKELGLEEFANQIYAKLKGGDSF